MDRRLNNLVEALDPCGLSVVPDGSVGFSEKADRLFDFTMCRLAVENGLSQKQVAKYLTRGGMKGLLRGETSDY